MVVGDEMSAGWKYAEVEGRMMDEMSEVEGRVADTEVVAARSEVMGAARVLRRPAKGVIRGMVGV